MISEIMKKKRLERGLTLKQIADKMGVSEATVQRWESGNIKSLRQNRIALLAEILQTTPSALMGWNSSSDKNRTPEAVPVQITGFIPVYGEIPAGVPVFEDEQIIDYISTTYPHPSEYFALKVKGNSMINAGIPNGCYVTIHKQCFAENGAIVACRVNCDEVTLKRFSRQGDTVILMPENPEFSPILINAKDFAEGCAQIIGVATDITIKL